MQTDKDAFWTSINSTFPDVAMQAPADAPPQLSKISAPSHSPSFWEGGAQAHEPSWSAGAQQAMHDLDAQSVSTKLSDMSSSAPSARSASSAGKKRRSRSILQGRTRVACTHCYQAKAGCDSKRPCSRCVRLNKEDECVDRVHKKRATGARRGVRRHQQRQQHQQQRGAGGLGRAGLGGPATGGGPNGDVESALEMSVESVASRFSNTLGEMWLYQCQNTLEESLDESIEAYQNACQRVVHVTEKLLGGLLDARMYAAVRARLQSIGIQVPASCVPIVREPFRLLSANDAGEPEELQTNGLNVGVIKTMQMAGGGRGLFINAEARRLFGFSTNEFCEIFNRQSSEKAFTPFWTWLITQNDWIKVIRHNAQFFLSLSDPVELAQRSDEDDTLVLRIVNRGGQQIKCLASTRSDPQTNNSSFSFCFIALGQS